MLAAAVPSNRRALMVLRGKVTYAMQLLTSQQGRGAMAEKRPSSASQKFEKDPKNQPWGTVVKSNMHLGHRKASREEVEEVTQRLSSPRPEKSPPDSNRTGALKESGIMNSYAWKGW